MQINNFKLLSFITINDRKSQKSNSFEAFLAKNINIEILIINLKAGGILILAFLILTNPRNVNLLGNRWLAFFLLTLFFLLIDESLFANKIKKRSTLVGFE